jgi:endonuclease YncB( thermonuclease family)
MTAVLLFCPAVAAASDQCPRGTLTGEVTFVRDGDTIIVGQMPIRLNGLAAPEDHEPRGDAATAAMVELVLARTLRCELDGERNHDRCVAICYLEDRDISDVLVRQGLARAVPRFSEGRYGAAEQDAAAAGATIRVSYPLPGYCIER